MNESLTVHSSLVSCVVGQVSNCTQDPSFINLRLQKKETGDLVAAQESALAIVAIGAVTIVPCPTIDQEWSHVFDKVPHCYKTLRKELIELEERVEERNKHRDTCIDFHPRFCPVSITA